VIGSFAADFEIRFLTEELYHAFAEKGMIIDNQNAPPLGVRLLLSGT
jgi:hypothetical protein